MKILKVLLLICIPLCLHAQVSIQVDTTCSNKDNYLEGLSFQKASFLILDVQDRYKILQEFIDENSVTGSGYEYAYMIDLNDNDGPEYIFVTAVPADGALPLSIIANVDGGWLKIFNYYLLTEFEEAALWGLRLLKTKTNGYYDLCFDGVKYKFNGMGYIQEQ